MVTNIKGTNLQSLKKGFGPPAETALTEMIPSLDPSKA